MNDYDMGETGLYIHIMKHKCWKKGKKYLHCHVQSKASTSIDGFFPHLTQVIATMRCAVCTDFYLGFLGQGGLPMN